jgi:hypothetical protein
MVLGVLTTAHAQWRVDESQDIFFPESLRTIRLAQSDFSVFWWNFIIVDPDASGEAGWTSGADVCHWLKTRLGQELQRVECQQNAVDYLPLLRDWATDGPLRRPLPSPAEWHAQAQRNLAQISLISGQPEILQMFRGDFFQQWQSYLKIMESKNHFRLDRQKGFLVEKESRRLVIPVQFRIPPRMSLLENFISGMRQYPAAHLVGGHMASYSNEEQIHRDIAHVSIVGTVILVLFLAFLVFKSQLRALWLLPPVFLATALAALVTNLVFGSIHGLTLAFGTGIVGLALDYGLHGTFNSDSEHTWVSNFIGLMTTLAGLLMMVASHIPLIKQMMFFSTMGIIFGYLFFYLLCKYFPRVFSLKPIRFPRIHVPFGGWITLALVLFSLVGFFGVQMQFDLRRFDFQPAANKLLGECI